MNKGTLLGIKNIGSYLRTAVTRRLSDGRRRAAGLLSENLPALVAGLQGAGLSAGRLDEISTSVKTLKEHGLYVKLMRAPGKETFLPSSNIVSLGYALSQARLLPETAEIALFLRKIIETYRAEGKAIPAGELDLAAARKQHGEAIAGLDPQEQRDLEPAYIMAAVKDNIRLASHAAMADNYEAMFELLDGVTVNSLEKAARSIVETAQRLWPGGNPTLMLYREEFGKPVLVPVAVALNESVIRQGEKVLNKRLGQYSIPIKEKSWNPYVNAFLRGETLVDRNLARSTFKTVCEGFIDHQFKGGILGRLFFGISFPGGENSLVFVPLIVADPLQRSERKIGIMAILKKGFFTQDQLREVNIFARSAARTLATVEWINELVQAKAEANAYAEEKAIAAGRLEQALITLKQTQEELVRKERMAAAGELAANVSHAVKNSNRVAGALIDKIVRTGSRKKILYEILERKAALGFQSKEDLHVLPLMEQENVTLARALSGELRESDRIVRGMLSFAKEDSAAKENIPLSRFMREREAGFATQAEKAGVAFYAVYRIDETDGVKISALDLGDILKNLVGNAIEALGKTSKSEKIVRLSVVHAPAQKESVTILVTDNGPGIAARDLGSIFSESRRGKSVHGTGLGLPEVRKKVERNGGTIMVTSREGEFTTFEIRFPWAKASFLAATGKEKPVIPRAVAEKIEVVFADDKIENRELTHENLREMGFPVLSYTSAEETLAAIEEGGAFPDLLMVDQDFGSGRMAGHTLIHKVAALYEAQGRKIPRFAIFSGDLPPAHGEVAEAVKKFNVKWITKGADVGEFRGEVSEAAVGEVENVASFYPSSYLEDNPFRMFSKGLCHKMNNSLQTLSYLQFAEPEIAAAREAFSRYSRSLDALALLAWSVGEFAGRSMKEIAADEEFSSNEIMKDKDVINGWNGLDPEQRYKMAIAILKYYDRVFEPAKQISSLLKRNILGGAELAEIAKLGEKIKEINDAFGLKTEAGEELAQFYALLETV